MKFIFILFIISLFSQQKGSLLININNKHNIPPKKDDTPPNTGYVPIKHCFPYYPRFNQPSFLKESATLINTTGSNLNESLKNETNFSIVPAFMQNKPDEKVTFEQEASSLLTFNSLKTKAKEIYDYYHGYFQNFSAQIHSNHDLKNIIIFSIVIFSLIILLICKSFCMAPIFMLFTKNFNITRKSNDESEKMLLKGRKILKSQSSSIKEQKDPSLETFLK